MQIEKIKKLATFLRYYSLYMSTKANSGHPTSSLSAADLMATFLTTAFRYDLKNPENPGNDRLVFSKGHASPLYYSLFAAMGAIPLSELDNYRKFTSNLEGHPTFRFPFTEAATGSLGQGLSIGVGLALALKMQESEVSPRLDVGVSNQSLVSKKTDNRPRIRWDRFMTERKPMVFVLLGDGEMAEGSTWEAIMIASKYKLDNLVGILDVNRLGQSGETMLGHDVATYQKRIASFGWATTVIDGHDYGEIAEAFRQVQSSKSKVQSENRPYMIIAKTMKGKGISFIENSDGWHGKPLPPDQLDKALAELGPVDLKLRVNPKKPVVSSKYYVVSKEKAKHNTKYILHNTYTSGDEIATRKAYGEALSKLGEKYKEIVALDGDVKNSTYSEIFKKKFPDRFFEMYIAEQNMVGVAVGLAKRGKIPFVSTFAAFLTRSYDQIRMAALSGVSIKFVGSHAGVSIGEDGPSQMGLEDLSMFRSIYGSTVLYPADAVSTEKLVEEMVNDPHIVYMRTSRPTTPVIYKNDEKFPIGGSKVHRVKNSKFEIRNSKFKKVVVVAAGVTLFEALKAQEELFKKNVELIVVDCYSVKPIDARTLEKLALESRLFVIVEDHWYEGGIGDVVLNVFAASPEVKVYKLAVTKLPRSGKSSELLSYEGISASSIVSKIEEILKK